MKENKRTQNRAMHNVGADRYLITYADLITLLLGLFVILYATSQVDMEKFKEYSSAFSEYFKAKDNMVIQGGDGVLEGHKMGIPEPILPPVTQKSVAEISEMTESLLAKFISRGDIELIKSSDEIRILLSEKLLFRSARAEVGNEGLGALDSISIILRDAQQQIFIDGHTDTDAIKTFQYESNWHLSVARATNVAYKLIRDGVPEFNMVIRGFGAQRPIADNTTTDGKARNRRVEITIKELTPESPSDQGYQ
ncbi:MAG: OmpA family protein [Candidatus Kapabacteria bacterium]|nr:OmpA family protein [Ignavibacteriota bacterium]MCW5884684.1 OmpA family protein [Candidatus Kapabacteria bacterium]